MTVNQHHWQTEPRNVLAVCRFRGSPGREQEAAEAWAFELTYYFLRGVGESPQVKYVNGVYTCTGLMTTTHPGDKSPVTEFDAELEPWDLDSCTAMERRERLLSLHRLWQFRFDGRDHKQKDGGNL
jgi:hypothetical protein